MREVDAPSRICIMGNGIKFGFSRDELELVMIINTKERNVYCTYVCRVVAKSEYRYNHARPSGSRDRTVPVGARLDWVCTWG